MPYRAAMLLLAAAMPAFAEESASFLKIGVGGRAAAMGGAYTAIADDVTAIAWNPAALSLLSQRELGAMHAQLASDIRYDFLGYAQPLRSGALAGSLAYLGQGPLQGRDQTGRLTSAYSSYDTAASVAYAQRLGSNLSLGLGIKALRSAIASYSAQDVALDLGGLYDLGRLGPGATTLGAAVQNIGPGMRYIDHYAPLPLTMALGLGYRLPAGLAFAADFKERPNAGSTEFSIGTEYAVVPSLALRLSYATNHGPLTGMRATDDLAGFGAGVGFKLRGYSFDYSVTPFGSLGNAQRFSVGARW